MLQLARGIHDQYATEAMASCASTTLEDQTCYDILFYKISHLPVQRVTDKTIGSNGYDFTLFPGLRADQQQ